MQDEDTQTLSPPRILNLDTVSPVSFHALPNLPQAIIAKVLPRSFLLLPHAPQAIMRVVRLHLSKCISTGAVKTEVNQNMKADFLHLALLCVIMYAGARLDSRSIFTTSHISAPFSLRLSHTPADFRTCLTRATLGLLDSFLFLRCTLAVLQGLDNYP